LTKLVNSSEDTILDDEVLIEHLDMSKIMSEDIKKSIDEKNIAQAEIIKQRMIYQELAERGSILYFTIFDLGRIEIMY
jgi:dynein heavy chain, axonemal